jgi:uncharacterized protein
MDESLFNKLKRLGMTLGGDQLASAPIRNTDYSVNKVIPGDEISTIFGACYRIKKIIDRQQTHGTATLVIEGEIGLVADWARLANLREQTAEHIVFLDTETTGLAGGTGTLAFLVGISQITPHGLEFTQFLLRDPAEERAMLTALSEYMTDARAVVTYNGKSFDIPLLNNRFLLHRLQSPFIGLDHIDLLHMARKIWKKKLVSKRLANVETEILRVERAMDEVPGYLVPQVYFDYLRTGDARPLAGVLYHNEMDVLSLTALLQYFMQSLSNLDDPKDVASQDLFPVVNLLIDMGNTSQACDLFWRIFQPENLTDTSDWEIFEKVAAIYRRNQEWELAKLIWQTAVDHNQEFGCLELAKYYEHREQNYQGALYYTESLIQQVNIQNLPPYTRKQRMEELQKRLDRIISKMAK